MAVRAITTLMITKLCSRLRPEPDFRPIVVATGGDLSAVRIEGYRFALVWASLALAVRGSKHCLHTV